MAKEESKKEVKTESFLLKKGQKPKVSTESKYYDKTSSAPGINANKTARFGA